MQFRSVPWLRGHLGGLLRELIASADVKVDLTALLRLPTRDDLVTWWEGLRDGGLVLALAGAERKALLDRVQAAMALVEGHAEHVMDAAGAPLLRSLPALRAALDRRRGERPPAWRLIERLLGLEMKMRQYEVGRGFVDAVVEQGGMAALNRAWTGPSACPRWPSSRTRRVAAPHGGAAARRAERAQPRCAHRSRSGLATRRGRNRLGGVYKRVFDGYTDVVAT